MDPTDLATAFEALEAADPVAFGVYRRRKLASGKGPTLQELGEEMELTRERVRQLEQRFEIHLRRTVSDNPDHPIRQASVLLEERLGALSRVENLAQVVDALNGGEIGALSPDHRLRILLDLAGPYDVGKKWCSRAAALKDASDLLARNTKSGPVPIGDAIQTLVSLRVSAENAEAWLTEERSYLIIDGHVVPRGRSMVDRGVSVLAVRGEPMTLEEIFALLDEKRSFRGFKGQMQGDERVMRRGLKHYGLREWGGEEYTTVTDEMMQEIERRGGSADLDELAEFLAKRFGISPSSVRMYAGGTQFFVDAKGRVAVASVVQVPATKPLALTRCCYRLPAGWAYRRTVDHEVLRGSGFPIPLGFAKELNVGPGDSLRLKTPLGEITCSWPSHTAHVGSIRRVAENFDATAGDYLFLIALGGGHVDFIHIAAAELRAADGMYQLAMQCGYKTGGDLEQIAHSLGIDAAISGPLKIRIRQQLLHRGEDELTDLVADDDEDLFEVFTDL